MLRLLREPTAPLVAPLVGVSLLYRYGGDGVGRGGGFLLLQRGQKVSDPCLRASELLLVMCVDEAAASAEADATWRLDPSVQALAGEARRALLGEPRPPLPYFEHLARAMVVAAKAAAERKPRRRGAFLSKPRRERVLQAIEARLGEPLSVDQLAAVAGMSRARFAAAFSATMGQSPMAYVRARRLERVRRELEGGEGDLARLAVRCGFSSHAHMTTAFCGAFGLPPSAYRARFSELQAGGDDSPGGGVCMGGMVSEARVGRARSDRGLRA